MSNFIILKFHIHEIIYDQLSKHFKSEILVLVLKFRILVIYNQKISVSFWDPKFSFLVCFLVVNQNIKYCNIQIVFFYFRFTFYISIFKLLSYQNLI